MFRTLADRISLVEAYPSVVAGVIAIAVFGASLLLLGTFSSIDLRDLLVPFTVGFLTFMLFYFVVMLLIEPYLRE